MGAYLRQQRGYGRAEALLIKQHPERFAWFGGARWRGAIYGSSTSGDVSDLVIDHGPFGSALFPTVYANQSPDWPQRCTGVPALLLSLIALGVGVIFKPALLISAMLFGSSIVAAFLITRRRWIRRGRNTKRGILLLWLMCWLQPIVRDWARFRGMIALGAWPRARRTSSGSLKISGGAGRRGSREHSVWIEDASVASDFSALLRSSCAKRRISCAVLNQPTSGWDFVIRCEGLRASVTCVTEYHERGRRLLRARCSRPRGPLWMVGLMFLPLVAAEAAHVMIYPPRRFGCGNWMLDYFLMQSALTILLMALSIWATGRLYSVVREALEAAASSAKNTDHPA